MFAPLLPTESVTPPRSRFREPVIYDVFEPDDSDFGINLDHLEVAFQLSIKAPMAEALFTDEDALFFGFTVRSFWQAYNDDISAPFRETNYEPEVFWVTPVPWNVFGGDAAFVGLGLSHQSNGRSQLFSRSWNRIYATLGWERWRCAICARAGSSRWRFCR